MRDSKDLSFISMVLLTLAILSVITYCEERTPEPLVDEGNIVLGNADSAGADRILLLETPIHYSLVIELDTLPMDSTTVYGTDWDSVVIEIYESWQEEMYGPPGDPPNPE